MSNVVQVGDKCTKKIARHCNSRTNADGARDTDGAEDGAEDGAKDTEGAEEG